MPLTKKFKVAELIYRLEDETHHVILIAADGDCYRVQLDCSEIITQECSRIGVIIEVSLSTVEAGRKADRMVVPDFRKLGNSSPKRLYFADSCELGCMIAKHWGKEAIYRLPPPAESISPSIQPRRPTDERLW